MDFAGKVVIVTGAGSGIGEDAAINFAKLGARVSLVDISESGLETVAGKLKSFGVEPSATLSVVADVTKDAAKIIDETIKRFGQLDVLVNNAGISKRGFPSSMDLDMFDQTIAVNCRAVIELTGLAIPHLEKTKGNIVNVSSVVSVQVVPILTAYCMSKAAIKM